MLKGNSFLRLLLVRLVIVSVDNLQNQRFVYGGMRAFRLSQTYILF